MPHPGIGRSEIGSFACLLLIVCCIADCGVVRLDFLDWPGFTAALLLVAGLPHGALHGELLTNRADDLTHISITTSVAVYIFLALSVALLWWLLPTAALIGLLVLSAYHFGGDWSGLKHVGERVIIGAALLSPPALTHQTSVAVIFSWLIPNEAASAVAGVMNSLSFLLLLSAAGVVSFRWQKSRAQCEEIVVVAFAATILPPFTFFVIYFCALHSMRHLADVRRTLSNVRSSAFVRRALRLHCNGLLCGGFGVFSASPNRSCLSKLGICRAGRAHSAAHAVMRATRQRVSENPPSRRVTVRA